MGMHPPGTKSRIIFGWWLFIQLQNSAEWWTDQTSIFQMDFWLGGRPNLAFCLAK
jgi:hypothetical protein